MPEADSAFTLLGLWLQMKNSKPGETRHKDNVLLSGTEPTTHSVNGSAIPLDGP